MFNNFSKNNKFLEGTKFCEIFLKTDLIFFIKYYSKSYIKKFYIKKINVDYLLLSIDDLTIVGINEY